MPCNPRGPTSANGRAAQCRRGAPTPPEKGHCLKYLEMKKQTFQYKQAQINESYRQLPAFCEVKALQTGELPNALGEPLRTYIIHIQSKKRRIQAKKHVYIYVLEKYWY